MGRDPPGGGVLIKTKKEIVGYSDELSVRPGDTIRFKVSSYGPDRYRADIVRLVCGHDSPDGPGFQEEELETAVSGEYPGHRQRIHPGSYVLVPAASALEGLQSFSVEAMIWPTLPGSRPQAVAGTWSESTRRGFSLFLDETGALALRLGGERGEIEEIATGVPLTARSWCFVAASYDANRGEVCLYQEPQPLPGALAHAGGSEILPPPVHLKQKVRLASCAPGRGPFFIAAWRRTQSKGRYFAGGHFNGKIDSPRLSNRALNRDEMNAILTDPVASGLWSAVVGAWDFSLDITSEKVTDLSANQLHGETVQMPTRGMTGANWDGSELNWRHKPEHYGAIHFHEDDLYDAGWKTDFKWTLPKDLDSGVYAARLRASESTEEDHIPFFVLPPRRPTAPSLRKAHKVALLASTATYMAYGNSRLHFQAPGVEMMRGRLTLLMPGGAFLFEHPECGLSLYDHHSDGSGVCYSSRLRPILDMRPRSRLWSFNADTLITAWLERCGHAYDVLTDEALHAEGEELLRPYQVVITGAHPEYFSLAMLDGLQAFTARGGRLMYLGGNGFYWRIAYHPNKPGVLEVRRTEDGTRAWRAEPGEYYHSFTGEYGGLWSRQRRSPHLLAGVGFAAQGFDVSSYYRRKPGSFDPRAAFVFDGIGDDELIGDFGLTGGGAAGEEIDRFDRRQGSPSHALVLASSEDHSASYMLTKEELFSNIPGTSGIESPLVRADMVFFETPGGGAVFSTGSIAWSASLCHNDYANNVATVTNNVLGRFMDETPFPLPEGR